MSNSTQDLRAQLIVKKPPGFVHPYTISPYGINVFGGDIPQLVKFGATGTYSVFGLGAPVVISSHYSVKLRYLGTEPTIEDIFSSVTYRYMALGCLDGPCLPFSSTSGGD